MPSPSETAVSPRDETGARPRRRLLVTALVLLVVAAVAAYVVASQHPIWTLWIHGATKKEYREKLVAEQDPDVIPMIVDGMRDADLSDDVRMANAQILLDKNRLSFVEAALKDPRLDVRLIAVRVLWPHSYFRKSYLDDESYGVKKTVVEWLRDKDSRTRGRAVSVASAIWSASKDATPPTPEVIAAVREMVGTPGAPDGSTRAAAAMALAGWGDCESAPTLLERAASETDFEARMRTLQAVAQLFDANVCGDRLPEAKVLIALDAALAWPGEDGQNRGVRMAAISLVARHPAWATTERLAKLRARLVDPSVGEPERRSALDALVAGHDAETLKTFARWFHDDLDGLRASAVAAVIGSKKDLPPETYNSCLVGFIRDETYSPAHNISLQGAYKAIQARSGRWIGLPTKTIETRGGPGDMSGVIDLLFTKGETLGVKRADVSKALWRWLCEFHGLKGKPAKGAEKPAPAVDGMAEPPPPGIDGMSDEPPKDDGPDEIDAATASRDAFWAKARAGDVAGAKAILEPLLAAKPGLWTYENGWILAKTLK